MAQVRDAIAVTIAGSRFELDPPSVEERLRGVLPEPVKDHFVVVDGRRFPPKQVITLVTGLDRADFTTHQARRILRRLGFVAGRKATRPPADPPRRPDDDRGAEVLRPYIGKWVALKDGDVAVAADTPEEVIDWLERNDVYSDIMFRVPTGPEETEVLGAY